MLSLSLNPPPQVIADTISTMQRRTATILRSPPSSSSAGAGATCGVRSSRCTPNKRIPESPMELKRASNSRKYDIGSLRAFDAFENTSKLDIPSFCTPKRSGTSGAVRRLMSTTSATCSSGAGSGDATDTGFWSLVMPSNLDYASSGDSDTSSSDRHEGAGAGSRLRDSVISRRRRQAGVLSASRHSQGISSRKQSSILDNVNEDPAATAVILDSPRTPSRRSFGRCGLPRTPSSTGGRHRLSCRIPNPLFLSPKRSHSTGAGTCTGTAVGADEDVDVDASGKPQTRMERKLAFDETKWDHVGIDENTLDCQLQIEQQNRQHAKDRDQDHGQHQDNLVHAHKSPCRPV